MTTLHWHFFFNKIMGLVTFRTKKILKTPNFKAVLRNFVSCIFYSSIILMRYRKCIHRKTQNKKKLKLKMRSLKKIFNNILYDRYFLTDQYVFN